MPINNFFIIIVFLIINNCGYSQTLNNSFVKKNSCLYFKDSVSNELLFIKERYILNDSIHVDFTKYYFADSLYFVEIDTFKIQENNMYIMIDDHYYLYFSEDSLLANHFVNIYRKENVISGKIMLRLELKQKYQDDDNKYRLILVSPDKGILYETLDFDRRYGISKIIQCYHDCTTSILTQIEYRD